jgi:hypothetical protein
LARAARIAVVGVTPNPKVKSMSEPDEFTESGQPIYRHGQPKKEFEFASGNEQSIEAIGNHIEQLLLYRDEMELKLKKGADALWEALEKNGVTELIDLNRKSAAKKRFGIF